MKHSLLVYVNRFTLLPEISIEDGGPPVVVVMESCQARVLAQSLIQCADRSDKEIAARKESLASSVE